MTNQTLQQSKSDSEGKAIISLILGVISISPNIFLPLLADIIPFAIAPMIGFYLFLIISLIALIGLISGILGLKSTKRNFAIAGIVLCLIGLLVPLYYFLAY